MIFNCLRLALICIILSHHFCHITNLFDYFQKELKPHAQSCFLFAVPGPATGDCYVGDFLHFYSAGLLNKERLENKRSVDVYNSFLLTQTIESVIAPMHPLGTYSFQYPPMFFALITPLAYFHLYTAWRIWFFAIAICAALTYIFIAYKSLNSRPFLLIGLFIFFTTYPTSQNFIIGQTTAIEAAIIALSFRLLIDKNYFWSGFLRGPRSLKCNSHQLF